MEKNSHSKRKILTAKKCSHRKKKYSLSKRQILKVKEKFSRRKKNSNGDKKVVRIKLSREDTNRIKIMKQ